VLQLLLLKFSAPGIKELRRLCTTDLVRCIDSDRLLSLLIAQLGRGQWGRSLVDSCVVTLRALPRCKEVSRTHSLLFIVLLFVDGESSRRIAGPGRGRSIGLKCRHVVLLAQESFGKTYFGILEHLAPW